MFQVDYVGDFRGFRKDVDMDELMDFLLGLTAESIANEPFPLKKVVDGSLFYPASGLDGSPLRHWPLDQIRSFVYVDWSINKDIFETVVRQNPPCGYSLIGMRYVIKEEIIPNGLMLGIPLLVNEHDYVSRMRMSGATPHNSFAYWCVFERNEGRCEDHGPERFSLFFIRAEGAAAYQAVYNANGLRPGAIAILRPGTGFGGSFPGFEEVMLDVMHRNRVGLPHWLFWWHEDGKGQQPGAPWNMCYADRKYGPYVKDGELYPWRSFSVYPLRGGIKPVFRVPVRAGEQPDPGAPSVSAGRFYVYALIDPSNGNRPFYIGKGFFDRAYQHFRHARADGADAGDDQDNAEDVLQVGGDVTPALDHEQNGNGANDKRARIAQLLQDYAPEDLIRVVARAVDETTALAVESLLIKSVYGLENLTNIQSGHHAERFRAVNDWGYLHGFDLPVDAWGNFLSDGGQRPCGRFYIYVLRDPDTGEVFYVGKGQGGRLGQHFDDVHTVVDQPEGLARLERLNTLLARGHQPKDIGRIVARVSSEALAYVIESCWIKFVVGFAQLTNIQPGRVSGMFRARDDWEPRLGFERPMRGQGARAELEDLFLGEGLDYLLSEVMNAPGLRAFLGQVSEPQLMNAGELVCLADIHGVDPSVKLRVQVRGARRLQVMLYPSNGAGRQWMEDRFGRIGCFPLRRQDNWFIPSPWMFAAGVATDPAEAIERALRLVALAQRLEAMPVGAGREALEGLFDDLLAELPYNPG